MEVAAVVLEAPEVLQSLVTTTEAAAYASVSASAVRMWAMRGHLQPSGRDERGRPLYRLLDVARAELQTRDRAGRRYPSLVA